ncbi:MAG: cofactor-independent phosphoglycerate mutase [bacterium]
MSRKATLLAVPDGMADWIQPDLGEKTPLEAAKTPNLDRLAEQGRVFRLQNIPDECPVDSGIANMALLGYDPRKYYLGRGALEALNLGIELQKGEVAFRCNLVTVANETLIDYSSENMSSDEARELFAFLEETLAGDFLNFYPGIRYRGIMVSKKFKEVNCYLPHDEMGRPLNGIWPTGPESKQLQDLMLRSRELLENHPINRKRAATGKKKANMIWPWGGGEMRKVPSLKESYRLEGNVIAGVDLINGLGCALGMKRENVPGATGDFDTDMVAKARRACEVLTAERLVFLHVEAPDEAGHEGNARLKKEMIEKWDRDVAGRLLQRYRKEPFRLAIGPDHYTPIQRRTHVRDPVPFLIVDEKGTDSLKYTEKQAEQAPLVRNGWEALATWYKNPEANPFVGD